MKRSIMASLSALALAASTTAALAAGMPSPGSTSAQDAAAQQDRQQEARMTHALNLLEAKGYGDFSNFRADGKNFDATVTQNGKAVNVVIDPDANQIMQQS